MYPSLWVSKPQGIQTDPSEIFISSITVINVNLLHQEQVVHARHSCLSIYLEVYQRHPAPFSSSEQYHISKTIQKKNKTMTNRERQTLNPMNLVSTHSQKLSDQHVRGLFRDVSHKHCSGGSSIFVCILHSDGPRLSLLNHRLLCCSNCSWVQNLEHYIVIQIFKLQFYLVHPKSRVAKMWLLE